MAKTLTLVELRKMNQADLRKEIMQQQRTVAKLRLCVTLGKEKGSHLLKSAKKQLAGMLTVLNELRRKAAVSVAEDRS